MMSAWNQATSRSLGRGRTVAAVLAGSWRASPPGFDMSPTVVADVAPMLLRSGAGGLAWWRASQAGRNELGTAIFFGEAYRLHQSQADEHEHRLQEVLRLLHLRGVKALVSKGWAVARLYPAAGLRPYGDFDLCVAPVQMPAAISVLSEAKGTSEHVDLHSGVPDLGDRSWHDVVSRSRLHALGDVEVRLLGPEDQLRQLCLHLLRHGAWRPLWLCDIAMFLESLPPGFDWDYCLHGERRLAEWILCVLGLARRLLGANPESCDLIRHSETHPGWIETAVLTAWGSSLAGDSHTRDEQPIAEHLRRLAGLLTALGRRWPNAIEAAVGMRVGPWTRRPRALLQLGFVLRRAGRFLARALGSRPRKQPLGTPAFALHQAG